MAIKKLKNNIPTAPVAHLPPLLVIEKKIKAKLKKIIKNCKTKLIMQTK